MYILVHFIIEDTKNFHNTILVEKNNLVWQIDKLGLIFCNESLYPRCDSKVFDICIRLLNQILLRKCVLAMKFSIKVHESRP